MDRSRQRGGGSDNSLSTVSATDRDLFAEGPDEADHKDSEGHFNAYAEASQALWPRRKPRPTKYAPYAQFDPLAGSEEGGEFSTAEPAKIEKPDQRADTETGSDEAAISALDDRAELAPAAIVPCVMTVEDVATCLRMSVSKVWRLRRKDPDFPQPIKIGGSSRWDPAEIVSFIEAYKARRSKGR